MCRDLSTAVTFASWEACSIYLIDWCRELQKAAGIRTSLHQFGQLTVES
jgi:hypothetical protein